MSEFLTAWIAATPALATPYILAALGLIIQERSGVLTLGAEGLMLIGAVCGIGFSLSVAQDPYLATLTAMVAASTLSLVFALMVVYLRINQVIAGLAIVFLCQGLSSLLGTVFGWSSRAIPGPPGLELITGVPFVSQIVNQDPIVYLAIVLAILMHLFLNRSLTGLKLRAVGESPETADSAGFNVTATRLCAILVGSALIGLAGAYLSVFSSKIWVDGMTGGRGWIAIALVIFARWNPLWALLGAFLFGGIEAAIPQIAAAGLQAPQYIILMAPYAATLAVMVWMGLRGKLGDSEPGSLGRPYVREARG